MPAMKYDKSSIMLPLAYCTRIDALEQVNPFAVEGFYDCVFVLVVLNNMFRS